MEHSNMKIELFAVGGDSARRDRGLKRFTDKPYYTYWMRTALMSGVNAKCPNCHGMGIVTARGGDALFRCTNCGYSETKDQTVYRYDVHNQCKACGRYYRADIRDEKKQRFPMLRVSCPFCKTIMPGKVHKTAEAYYRVSGAENGRDPCFGLELWFLTTFRNKPIWALNREHLAYLIDYLSADLREKPDEYPMRTQADHLPTFMKTAKNRKRIVKILKYMQNK